MENSLLWKVITLKLLNIINEMIQKLIGMPKDDIEIILKLLQLHHQLNIDHDILVLQYITCSLVSMFILINDESNIFDCYIFTL